MKREQESIGKWISIIHRYGKVYFEKELKPYNIGSGQIIFLMMLLKKDGISQEFMAEHLKIDKGTTARAIKKLEKEGYVIRKVDPEDKRAYKVYTTEKAVSIKPKIKKILSGFTEILEDSFTEEEKELLLKLLKKMAENAAMKIKGKED
ncbi:MarR family transcriptional regulator [Crassaminicella thermophila]|uniref:MarR family transcriptional regulator n=1 Tax=Crassaminicella thermophila TaxID=2599308 RepID=A0A5C0SIN5_CRATE|nr:MarR family transcriptional regulator [Crassaminicella thermophila]QEK13294.1 MarR family transcriptional regulator [Crassaminicella thermophila]